jgi:predicted ester cyclase
MRRMKHLNGFLIVTTMVVTAACGSEPPKNDTAAPPAPKPKTVQERVARYQECWDDFNKRSFDAFKGCYTDTATSEQMGSRPALSGGDAIIADAKTFFEAFPDAAGTLRIVLAKEDTTAALAVLTGTHNGPLPALDGKPIPATKKPTGYYMGHVIHWDAMGDKATREESYIDSPTLMSQLGLMPGPTRPVEPKPIAPPTIVATSGSETESTNVEAFRAQMELFNQHDLKGLEATTAPGAMFHDLTAPKDTDARGNIAELRGFIKAFPDCRLVTTSVWGAGDYVVAQGTFEGTNNGAAPMMNIKKPTKKAVKVPFLEITRFEGGKVKEDWVAFDSLAFALQLELMSANSKK